MCRYELKRSGRHDDKVSLIIDFTDYKLYDAVATVASVLHNDDISDRRLLAEIILVDAGSTLEHIRKDARDFVEAKHAERQVQTSLNGTTPTSSSLLISLVGPTPAPREYKHRF